MKNIWYIWSKALGEKASDDESISDKVAIVRTAIILIYILTNFFIVAGIFRHWND